MNSTGCRPFTKQEIELIHSQFDGRYQTRDRALFTLALKTGYRVSELLSIRVCDVFANGQMKDEVTVAACWMKGGKASRNCPLNETASNALEEWLRESKMTHPLFAQWPLFPAQGKQKAITTRQAFRILLDAVVRAGVDSKRVGFHSCRKSYAMACFNHPLIAGSLPKMSKLLGHRNPSNTLRYLEWLNGDLERAVMEI